jgi:hypothetical protein
MNEQRITKLIKPRPSPPDRSPAIAPAIIDTTVPMVSRPRLRLVFSMRGPEPFSATRRPDVQSDDTESWNRAVELYRRSDRIDELRGRRRSKREAGGSTPGVFSTALRWISPTPGSDSAILWQRAKITSASEVSPNRGALSGDPLRAIKSSQSASCSCQESVTKSWVAQQLTGESPQFATYV